jgi:hypothetical protein
MCKISRYRRQSMVCAINAAVVSGMWTGRSSDAGGRGIRGRDRMHRAKRRLWNERRQARGFQRRYRRLRTIGRKRGWQKVCREARMRQESDQAGIDWNEERQ